MGIRFNCPNGHKLNVKEFLAGKRGVCPQCGAKFIIPMPAQAPAAQTPLPVGAGLPQSIEIAVAPNQPVISPVPIPPTVARSADSELELAPPELILSPAMNAPPIAAADALPVSILPVQPSLASAPPIIDPVDSSLPLQRERGRRNQVVISILLLILVLVLAGVLAWVLKREANRVPVEKDKTTTTDKTSWRPTNSIVNVAICTNLLPIRSNYCVGARLS